MTMMDLPDRGEEKDWAALDPEEVRCLLGLINYWKKIGEKDEQTATMKGWEDLQYEFPRLQNFKWFKGTD